MKVIDTIPYYLVEVRIHENIIQCYDQAAKKVLKSRYYLRDITKIRKEHDGTYLALNEKDEIMSEISIHINLLFKKSELKTDAGYILDLQMVTPSHGFYFGYYEIGEFKTEDSNLEKIWSYPIQYCTRGRITKSKHIYLGCRADEDYFLVKLIWKSIEAPEILWKKHIPSAIMSMDLMESRLYIGLKTGALQIWDINKDECLKVIELFSSPVSVLTIKEENITITSKSGDVARVSDNGDLIWKINLTQDEVVGIYEDTDYILAVNKAGTQFHIDVQSGKLQKHNYSNLKLEGNAGLSSNIIKYRNRFIITGYGGIWSFRWDGSNSSYHTYMDDPLMRVLCQHPFGFYSGDDDGCVCFWDLGNVEIELKNFLPYLSYEGYKELKEKQRQSFLKRFNLKEK
jgi:hypothetical protein